ncbi:fused -like amino acid oxidase domain uncharacterized domain-containing, putative [Babesia ovis]|uniref:Fused -like amino acid oxidase domain uncharacterized domain-containing, putative n=1 Tax=Babesia ovis TaxID=5869 RepID=A0A9W5TC68_BABOV|nr:fused -like amino acid oxidase domain uncharacterized domain-containing, putative [Babesia ovis]
MRGEKGLTRAICDTDELVDGSSGVATSSTGFVYPVSDCLLRLYLNCILPVTSFDKGELDDPWFALGVASTALTAVSSPRRVELLLELLLLDAVYTLVSTYALSLAGALRDPGGFGRIL